MTRISKVLSAMVATGMAFISAPAAANLLTYQNVTFVTTSLGGNQLQLEIENALNATGDWSGITYLGEFEVKSVGGTAASLIGSPAGWTYSANELNAGGCTGGVSGGACFIAPINYALSNDMVIDIQFVGTTDFSLPHLKVLFLNSDNRKTGSLLSMDVPPSSPDVPIPVPEPAALALLGIGLAGIGFAKRRA